MTVTVKISKDGRQTVIDVDGVQGQGCKALTEAIEKALGRVTDDEHKPEYQTTDFLDSLKAGR